MEVKWWRRQVTQQRNMKLLCNSANLEVVYQKLTYHILTMISHEDMKSEWENSTNNDGCMLQGLDAKNYIPQSVVELGHCNLQRWCWCNFSGFQILEPFFFCFSFSFLSFHCSVSMCKPQIKKFECMLAELLAKHFVGTSSSVWLV